MATGFPARSSAGTTGEFPPRGRVVDVQGTTGRRRPARPVPLSKQPGTTGTGDHKGRPYDSKFDGARRAAEGRRGRACPVPLSGQPGTTGTGDHKGRPDDSYFDGARRAAAGRRGRACPVPLSGQPGTTGMGDHKGRPYDSYFDGSGPTAEVVGDWLVPSRCPGSRAAPAPATTRVAPTIRMSTLGAGRRGS